MQFSVEISTLTRQQYENVLKYLAEEIKNSQALAAVMDDFDDTILRLEKSADSYGYCSSERLKELGLHKILFSKHRYLFVYRIVGNVVIVEGMYHELQDYENSI